METTHPVSFTPEQLAAVRAGKGYALLRDQETNRVFVVIERPARPTISDQYVREKLDEAIAASERGETAAWDSKMVKKELHSNA